MTRFDWQLNFLTVHACQAREKGQGMDSRSIASFRTLGEEEEVLERLIDGLLIAAFKKKPDIGASSACKAYTFLDTDTGRRDRQMLTTALDTEQLGQFEEMADDMAARYSDLAEANPALLIQLRARVTTPQDAVMPFYVMFACDFEEVSVLTGEKERLLDRIGEAVVHKLRKSIVYPFLDAGLQDPERLVLYQAASSEGFSDMLALEEPRTAPELFNDELKAALDKRAPQPAYEKYFREPPPATRPLFGEERYVHLEHLLAPDEAKHVSDITYHGAKEKFDKEMKLRVVIDDYGRFEATLDRLNRDFFFARRGEEKYLIVRAEEFITKEDNLSAVEFMQLEDLDAVLKKMGD